MNDENIYLRQDLMEIYKYPSNRGKLEDPTVEDYEVNKFCGDEVLLQLKIENDKIVDAKFSGDACAVGIISSSLVTEEIIGKTLQQAKNLTKEKVLEMVGTPLTTSRVKCATLVLEALQNALKKYE